MTLWINPKTDWKETDYINYADFNRIETNTSEIAALLQDLQIAISGLITVTNRDNTSIDYISSINRIESNLKKLKDNFITPPGYLDEKAWAIGTGFSYDDSNRLENNLKLLYDWIPLVKASLKYCGTFICGEEGEIY